MKTIRKYHFILLINVLHISLYATTYSNEYEINTMTRPRSTQPFAYHDSLYLKMCCNWNNFFVLLSLELVVKGQFQ